jgi:hypothetical protein
LREYSDFRGSIVLLLSFMKKSFWSDVVLLISPRWVFCQEPKFLVPRLRFWLHRFVLSQDFSLFSFYGDFILVVFLHHHRSSFPTWLHPSLLFPSDLQTRSDSSATVSLRLGVWLPVGSSVSLCLYWVSLSGSAPPECAAPVWFSFIKVPFLSCVVLLREHRWLIHVICSHVGSSHKSCIKCPGRICLFRLVDLCAPPNSFLPPAP